jgi:hypothetical protein
LKSKARTRSFEVHNFEVFRFVLQHYLNPFWWGMNCRDCLDECSWLRGQTVL